MKRNPFPRLLDKGIFAIGFALGAFGLVLTALVMETFGFEMPLDTAFFGAIIGALVAGIIGVFGQLLVLSQNQEILDENRRNEEAATLESLFAVLLRNSGIFYQLKEHAESTKPFDNFTLNGEQSLMKPFRLPKIPKGFTDEQLSFAIQLGNTKLFNLLNLLDAAIRSFAWSHSRYESKADDLLIEIAKSATLTSSEGRLSGVANLELSPVVIHELKDLMDHNRADVYSALLLSIKSMEIVKKVLNDSYGKSIITVDILTEDELSELSDAIDIGEI